MIMDDTAKLSTKLWGAPVAALAMGLISCGEPAPAPLSESAQRGATVFAEHCVACHSDEYTKTPPAPSLKSVIGRKAGATGFPYSSALRNADIVWSKENLDRFLATPLQVVPNNQMAFYGMDDAAARADLIEFMAANSPPPHP